MKLLKLCLATLAMAWCAFAVKAEDAKTPEAPKPVEAKTTETKPTDTKPADASATEIPKTADTGDLPKAPDGTSPINAAHENEALVGDISQGPPDNGKGKEKSAKKAVPEKIVHSIEWIDTRSPYYNDIASIF